MADAFQASDLPDKPRGLEELSDFVVAGRSAWTSQTPVAMDASRIPAAIAPIERGRAVLPRVGLDLKLVARITIFGLIILAVTAIYVRITQQR